MGRERWKRGIVAQHEVVAGHLNFFQNSPIYLVFLLDVSIVAQGCFFCTCDHLLHSLNELAVLVLAGDFRGGDAGFDCAGDALENGFLGIADVEVFFGAE
jgi:hypothetical protein